MKGMHRWRCLCAAGLGLGLVGLTGCQTWIGGMTLPSGYYLQHRPQYFPPDPDFPLQRELGTMEAQNALAAPPGLGVGELPPEPVVPPVGPGAPGPAGPAGRPGGI